MQKGCKKAQLNKLARKYGLSMILIYGSQVNEKVHKDSDLDIAVMARKEFNFKKHFSLISDLAKIFLGREIDLVFINRANPLFLKKILENCQMVYGKERKLALLKIYVFKRYCDYKKFFDLEEKFVRKFIHKPLKPEKIKLEEILKED